METIVIQPAATEHARRFRNLGLDEHIIPVSSALGPK